MMVTAEIVLSQSRGKWYWRIDANGQTTERAKDGEASYLRCAAAASIAYHTRYAAISEGVTQ